MSRLVLLALLLVSRGAGAIMIRDDIADAEYRVLPAELPALADLPTEGHGVLIAPSWVITAAHAVTWQEHIDSVTIGNVPRRVERLVLHPGYRKLPKELTDEALKSSDWSQVMASLAASDDVALLKLAQPVTDVAPIAIYRGRKESGMLVKLLGKGATGTGLSGQDPCASHRTELRRAFNRITRADDHWLVYEFDKSPAAVPLEGITGDGDSGGPVLVQIKGDWQLAGLASWKDVPVHAVAFRPGMYGQVNRSVRVSHYAAWIDSVIAADTAAPPAH